MKTLGYICVIVAGLVLAFEAGSCWFFRDGLGPDSIESAGIVAWSRFWRDFRFALIIVAPLLFMGLFLIRSPRFLGVDWKKPARRADTVGGEAAPKKSGKSFHDPA